ncbi:hypothetical protein MYCTH_2310212 [Thermothelomyces thermophilus ATCC 42464]|uniref:2EXR domain-containing protein n=1 Tax=Thermothelomyces thermophilus (strain ATCC 42464 / BCRC 31852 / DSM 1799) TaxID=573729 RepID=G2QL67_THET4|nr:uncharacterized protein MYCTH_2310212 [Thermothelomyces thermophilus ATCC 42464]AEO60699.1 hypothetical protein MYCTH_2310212 [Thermothelomyces thermophilus ATCC 42464]
MTSPSLRSSFPHSSSSLSSSPSSSSSFTLFRHLPPELRLQIYRHACHPRVASLTYLPAPQDTFYCPTRPPALLHVCRESRAEGLRIYVKCPLPNLHHTTTTTTTKPDDGREGQGDDVNGGERGRDERYFYFHPHHDTLYLPRPGPAADPFGLGYADWARELAAAVAATFAGVVRRLAVDYVPAEVRRPWEAYGKICLIGGCPRLEEAYLVVSGAGAGACAAGERGGAEREVELVDPGDGDGEIAEIMERVRESFRVELGDGIAGLLGAPGKDGERSGRSGEVGLELIPKAKMPSPSWAGRRLVCAS